MEINETLTLHATVNIEGTPALALNCSVDRGTLRINLAIHEINKQTVIDNAQEVQLQLDQFLVLVREKMTELDIPITL